MNTVCHSLRLNTRDANCRRNIIVYVWFRLTWINHVRNTRLTCFGIMPVLALSRTIPLGCIACNIASNEDTRLSAYYVLVNWYGIITGRLNTTLYAYCVRILWWRFLFNISIYKNSTRCWLHIAHNTYSETATTTPGFHHHTTTIWNLNTIITITYITLVDNQSILCQYSRYLISGFVIFILYQNCRRTNIAYGAIY